jgi:hypothetical protein
VLEVKPVQLIEISYLDGSAFSAPALVTLNLVAVTTPPVVKVPAISVLPEAQAILKAAADLLLSL